MAASRTSTAAWKRIVKEARAQAIERGLQRCPLCGVILDWEHAKRPASAEVDHIKPASLGGLDEIENVRIICRRDNQRLGGELNRKRPRPVIITTDLDGSDW